MTRTSSNEVVDNETEDGGADDDEAEDDEAEDSASSRGIARHRKLLMWSAPRRDGGRRLACFVKNGWFEQQEDQ
jgi:hypothetical protein